MQNSTDIQFMTEALELAKKAKQAGDFPFGAVIVCNGKVVGRGKCENNTTGDVTDHAELLAIRDACNTLQRNNLNDCVIYTTNEPCPMCAAGIFQAKIPTVIVGITREDLPNFFRKRKIRMKDLAEDSGYEINISTGILKGEILREFEHIKNKS